MLRYSRKLLLLVLFLPMAIFSQTETDAYEWTLASPFYTAYADDWVVKLETVARQQGYDVNFSLTDAEKTTRKTEVFSELSLTYGIFESLAVGTTAKAMFQQKTVETATGFLKNTPLQNTTENGFYDPSFFVTTRLLGTMQNEWTLNVQLAFAPGIEDPNNGKLSTPNNRYLAALLFGKDWRSWSFGTMAIFQYHQKTTSPRGKDQNDQQTLAPNVFIQYDIGSLYFRSNTGVSLFLDSASRENPIRRNTFLLVGGELGLLAADNFLVKLGLQWTSGVTENDELVSPLQALQFTTRVRDSFAGSIAFMAQF